jgi:predicted patatin/cPLA2 family phospholipase
MSIKEKNYEALVVSGGGIKLFLSLGFLDYLDELEESNHGNKLKNIKYYAGTSSGAIITFLLAIGYTPKEIMSYTCTNDILKFLNQMSLLNLPIDFGLIDTKLGIRYLELMALKKLSYIPTFNDIYTKLGIFFMCPAYNLNGTTRQESETYFSPLTHGDMNVCEAVAFSSTVPIVFTKSQYKNCLYIDGGLFDMCPVDKLASMCGIQNKDILCLTYKEHFDSTEIKSVFDYAKKVFSSVIKKYSITLNSDKLDIVKISSDAQTLDFSMSVKDRIKLYLHGKSQANNYFQHSGIEEETRGALPRLGLEVSISAEPRRDSCESLATNAVIEIDLNEKKQNENTQIEKNKVD